MKTRTSKIQKILITLSAAVVISLMNGSTAFAEEVEIFSNDIKREDANTLILDDNDTGGDIKLQFGNSLNESILWDSGGTQFIFSDDQNIQGSLDVDGTITAGSANTVITQADGKLDGEQIADDTIDDDSIDFGMGADQVGADDVTVTDEFDNSNSLNVQDVLDDLDAAIGGGDPVSTTSNIFTLDSDDTGGNVDLIFGTTVAQYLRHDGSIFHLSDNVNIEATGEALELGTNTATDTYISFDDDEASDQQFGWDDSEESFSTFDEELSFRTRQGATPPVACGATYTGMQWMDTDTGMIYVCDTSNSRNKWLSQDDNVVWGEANNTCEDGSTLDNDTGCTVDWGASLGPDADAMGFYIPNDLTITGYGYSEDGDACISGSFDLEVWGTASNSDDTSFTFDANIATSLTGGPSNSKSLNVDIAGEQYIMWGMDNNCGQAIDDWNTVIYYRWRHD